MKSIYLVSLALATAVTDSPCSSTCCFGLTAAGGQSCTIGHLDDGQTRIGGGLAPSKFCLAGTSIKDSAGRGCIITEPQTQWQWDSGKAPFPGFTIGCGGLLTCNGTTTFCECQTGDNGEANIYTTPGGADCATITLTADNCMSCQIAGTGFEREARRAYRDVRESLMDC